MHSQSLLVAALLVTAIGVLSSRLEADIIETDGAMLVIAPPESVRTGDLESNDTIFVFEEQSRRTIEETLELAISEPGFVTRNGPFTSEVLAVGSVVSSYYVHFDKVGSTNTFRGATGSITFDEDILGFIVCNACMDAADSRLGSPFTEYPTEEPARGFFDTQGNDWVDFADNRQSVEIHCSTAQWVDSLRIITGLRACTGDVTGDREVDFADLVAVLSEWGPCAECREDVDGSGEVDFEDLLVVLANWGLCP